MRTTIDLPDALLQAAKDRARAEGTTLRAVFEEGLRAILATDAGGDCFTLRDASVEGRGLQDEFSDAGWAEMRDASYEGRGA